ncbi:flagellar basal body rod protein FlgB [Clostridiaceae bacterium]|nr:flagellar basal body rod protein FlgB [Clostridiaceae bacterium]RKI11213.1 flagellar basal body rod protein FlgB [bacterium 1XD21-70]
MNGIYGNGVALSEKVLDYLWGRQSVSLNNVANVDTPGFKSQYVTFEEEMGRRLSEASSLKKSPKKAVSEAIRASQSKLNTTWQESSRLDGNNVDMDQEQVEIVRTAYQYQYVLNSITNDINRLKSAAKTF